MALGFLEPQPFAVHIALRGAAVLSWNPKTCVGWGWG